MKLRLPAATVALVLLGGALSAPAAQADPSTTIVISKIMTRGPAGGNDEFIELKNKSTGPVAIGGWQLWGTNASGSSQTARVTITAGTELAPGAIYRLTNSLGGQTGGNQTYSTGITDDGGLQLRSSAAATSVVDAVGSEALTGPAIPFREGAGTNPGLVFPTANGENAFTRKGGGHAGHRRQRRGLRRPDDAAERAARRTPTASRRSRTSSHWGARPAPPATTSRTSRSAASSPVSTISTARTSSSSSSPTPASGSRRPRVPRVRRPPAPSSSPASDATPPTPPR